MRATSDIDFLGSLIASSSFTCTMGSEEISTYPRNNSRGLFTMAILRDAPNTTQGGQPAKFFHRRVLQTCMDKQFTSHLFRGLNPFRVECRRFTRGDIILNNTLDFSFGHSPHLEQPDVFRR